uniref:tRNA (guanine(10)-N(2))-methyltransferase TRMT11 n=2 Tax=Rhodnius prolixus TaxID=13249 RepID=T1I037_RHOPR
MSNTLKRYLLWFANEHLDFRIPEIKSIAKLYNITLQCTDFPSSNEPFWIVEIDGDDSVKKIAERSVLLRYAIDLWAVSSTKDKLDSYLRLLPKDIISPYTRPDTSFKIKVEIFGNSQTQREKVEKIESFSYLPLSGPVKLKNPDVSFQYIEFFALEQKQFPLKPEKYFFGRLVAEGQRDLISKLSLKKRKFIGNTTMDPQLSLIMANQGQIKEGDIVLDPFVGTGSLLIAAAQFGGYVLGADIDYLMVHGKSRPTRKQNRHKPRNDESIANNMEQYGLKDKYLDIVVADSSLPYWRPGMIFDVIVTDPPYGIREAMERVGCTRPDKFISEEHVKTHIPSKVQYNMSQLLADLLKFAAKHLRTGGKLVTWIPIIRFEYSEHLLPQHECLKLEANSEQVLSTTSSRRLLTYTKITE